MYPPNVCAERGKGYIKGEKVTRYIPIVATAFPILSLRAQRFLLGVAIQNLQQMLDCFVVKNTPRNDAVVT